MYGHCEYIKITQELLQCNIKLKQISISRISEFNKPLVSGPVHKTVNRSMVIIMVFSATFNNISVISWRSALLVGETAVPEENHRPVASDKTVTKVVVLHKHYINVLFAETPPFTTS